MLSKSIKLVILLMIIAVIVGFLDSSYLFYKYLTASPIDCLLFDGCNTVAKSPYSHVFGVPLPLFGMIFYTLMLGSIIFLSIRKNIFFAKVTLALGFMGFAFSLYFIYLQGFIIQAFCIYCLVSALTSTILFCAAIYVYQYLRSLNARGNVTMV